MLWQLEAFKGLCRSLPDGLNSLIVCLHLLLAPAQFFATKLGEEAQTGPAEYLATSAIMSKGDYSFEAQCSLPGLTTAASAHQADQSLPDQSSPNIMASNHLWGDWAKAPLPRPSCIPIFKACRGCTRCRYQVLISVSAAPPNFWPD